MAIRYVFRFDGFTDFDEGWIFDNAHGCDICEITVEDVVTPPLFSWQWIDIGPPTTEAYYTFSSFTSGDETSFIVDYGPSGTYPGMAKTVDNGETWTAYDLGDTPVYFNVTGRDFFDGTIYLVYAPDNSNGVIFRKTTNGGSSWTEVVVVADDNYGEGMYMVAPSKNIIYIFYPDYTTPDARTMCYKSIDSGDTWSSVVLSTTAVWDEEWHWASALDSNHVAVVYEKQYHDVYPQWKREIKVSYTSNGGTNWNDSIVLTDNWGYDYEYLLGIRVLWYDTNTLFVCASVFQWPENHGGNTGFFGVWKSIDGGATWSGPTKLFEYAPNYGGDYSITTLKVQEDGNIYTSFMDDSGTEETLYTFTIWKSEDVGTTWEEVYQNQFDYLEVYFWNTDLIVKADGRMFVYCCAIFDNNYLTGYRDSIYAYI